MAFVHADPGSQGTQDLVLWQTSSGTVASATDAPDAARRALKFTINNAGSLHSALNHTYGASNRGSFECLFDAWPNVSQVLAFPAANTAASDVVCIGINSAGKIVVQGAGTTAKTGTTVLAVNTRYRISWARVITTTANWGLQVWLNGVAEINTGNGANGLGNSDGTLTVTAQDGAAIYLGNSSDFSSFTTAITGTMNVWCRAWVCDNDTSMTEIFANTTERVLATCKRPFTDGTNVDYVTAIGSAGGYGSGDARYVNERPTSTANGRSVVTTSSTTKNEQLNVENAATGDDDLTGAAVKAVLGWMRANVSNTGSMTMSIIVDGTVTAIADATSYTTYLQVSPNPTTLPAGSGTDIGVRSVTTTSASRTARLAECGILVAYVPASLTAAQEIPAMYQLASGMTIGRVDA